ncbi:hypothetical protein ACIQNU_14025 [Streptomyces sp. NPDC091292]|uniref:hypothetical protein n=1 Tax=Streptomyces sp. NPDC091292 TaxID=3365991 RepID=UPI00380128E6
MTSNTRRTEADRARRRGLHDAAAGVPDVGTVLYDTVTDKVGEFRGENDGRYLLRPPGGGVEWDAAPGDVEPPGSAERLRAKAAAENRDRARFRL